MMVTLWPTVVRNWWLMIVINQVINNAAMLINHEPSFNMLRLVVVEDQTGVAAPAMPSRDPKMVLAGVHRMGAVALAEAPEVGIGAGVVQHV